MFQSFTRAITALLLLPSMPLLADTTQARCDIYPQGEDHTDVSGPCTFSQRQGFISIEREDGVRHELAPEDGEPTGTYRDQKGNRVYRQSGLGSAGLIFRFPEESVYVYWSGAEADGGDGENNATAPYSTDDYEATALLSCSDKESGETTTCPAGILRMESGEASIVVTSPRGEEFTINFMKTYVNASNREVDATLRGDIWWVTVDGQEIYQVPLAAIEGG
jgi:hypothetical protein